MRHCAERVDLPAAHLRARCGPCLPRPGCGRRRAGLCRAQGAVVDRGPVRGHAHDRGVPPCRRRQAGLRLEARRPHASRHRTRRDAHDDLRQRRLRQERLARRPPGLHRGIGRQGLSVPPRRIGPARGHDGRPGAVGTHHDGLGRTDAGGEAGHDRAGRARPARAARTHARRGAGDRLGPPDRRGRARPGTAQGGPCTDHRPRGALAGHRCARRGAPGRRPREVRTERLLLDLPEGAEAREREACEGAGAHARSAERSRAAAGG